MISHNQKLQLPSLFFRFSRSALVFVLALWSFLPPIRAEIPKTTEKRLGWAIRLPLPIDGAAKDRIQRFVRRTLEKTRAENAQAVLIFKFDVPPGQENFGRGSDFGAAYELADFLSGEELNAATTVAYLPKSIQGHAVLAALACDEIIMAKDATLGPAGVDEKIIRPPVLSAYKEIAQRRRTLPEAVALGLLDPALEVLAVGTDLGTEYVTSDGLEELKKKRATQPPEVLKPAGEPWQFSSGEMRRQQLISYLADDDLALAQALDLPPMAIEDDPSLGGEWRTVRIDLKKPIRQGDAARVQKLIEDKTKLRGVNFVCLWIDSPGGSPDESATLANYLAGLAPGRVRTVAYIPYQALSDAAIIAEACDHVVMHPEAVLGGSGDRVMSPEEIEHFTMTIRDSIAKEKGRPWSLIAALINPKLEVFRCTRPGEVDEYFSDDELREQPQPGKWTKGERITTPGRSLQVDGRRAEELNLATRVVDDFQELKNFYALQNDPELVEPGWADVLIEALGQPGVAILLLIIGFAGIYLELQSPGIGVGAFVALVCFVLFFWSHYLDRTANWLEVLLFLTGILCLLLEVFVLPGFGIFGLGGGVMILLSLILASQTFTLPQNEYQRDQLQRSLLTIAGAGGGVLVAGFFLRKWLPNTPLLNRLILAPPDEVEQEDISHREMLVDLENLLGAFGVTTTPLYPAGKARIGQELVDVIADGEMIERGVEIEVVEVRGNRVLVREVNPPV